MSGWIAENCIRRANASQLLKELYADWRAWCEASHEEPGTNRSFKKKLERLGDLTFRPSGRSVLVKGLRCRSEDERRQDQADLGLEPDEVNG